MMVKIVVFKKNSLVDERLRIVIRHLLPRQDVTVSALLQEKRAVYASHAAYTADQYGQLDLSTMPSQAGTYKGISGMGLFWSMQLTPDITRKSRLENISVTAPLITSLSVHPGHVTIPDPRQPPSPSLVSLEIPRWFKHPDVERIEVRENGLVGTLFIPKGTDRRPGIIDLFSVSKHLVEFKAALLASRGFVTLALCYTFLDENPPFRHDLEYYEKAVNFLQNHPRVRGGGIGMIGFSKGAEICLSLSTVCPHVKAVAAIAASPWNTCFHQTYKGWTLPSAGFDAAVREKDKALVFSFKTGAKTILTKEGLKVTLTPKGVPAECFIPVERSHAKLLLVSGDEDPLLHDGTANIIPDRMHRAGRGAACRSLRYHRAGHLIHPPYIHNARTSNISGGDLDVFWGGTAEDHARAQEDMWQQILEFFNKELPQEQLHHKL